MAYQPKSYRKFIATAAAVAVVAPVAAPAFAAANFTDVPASYKEAVDYLVSKGINGKSETTFGTQETITRLDAAIFVAKVAGLDVDNAPDAGFKDVPANRAKFVNALKAEGITAGKSTTSFGAYDNITRGELAKWLVSAFDLKGSADISAFNDVPANYADAVKALVANTITSGTSATTFGTYDNAKRGDFAKFVYKAANTTPVSGALAVESVNAINAKTLEVTFNKAVDPSTVINDKNTTDKDDDTIVSGVITATTLDGHSVTLNTAKAKLSDDAKTITLELTGTEFFKDRYDVKVAPGAIKTVTGENIAKYSGTIDVDDKVAPSILSTTNAGANKVKVVFSEPMQSLGSITFKLADGTVVSSTATGVTNDFNALTNNTEVTFTIGNEVDANENVTATIVGALDYAGNIISPNPATLTLHKGDKDGVKPTVSSVKFLNSKTLEVIFSEELSAFTTGNISVSGSTIASVDQDDTNKAKYKVNLNSAVSGIQYITMAKTGIVDLSGEVMKDDYSTGISVTADTTAPTLTSATVKKGTDNAEYLHLTFGEDVTKLSTATFTLTGTQYKDYVTTNTGNITLQNADLVAVSGTKNEFKIKLSNLTPALEDGTTYSLGLPASLVEDTTGNDNDAKSKAIVFTRGVDGTASSTYQTVASVTPSADNNKVTVVFGQTVDGASAVNKANYSITGATIDTIELASDKKTVTLNLVKDATTYSGARYITIDNVKTAGGSATLEEAYNEPISLNENVRPTVIAAKATGANEITLTFSEDVDVNGLSNGTGADFGVYFDGVLDTADVAAVAVSGDAKKVTLTTTKTIDTASLAAGITVKKATTIDLTDILGNGLNMQSPVNVTLN